MNIIDFARGWVAAAATYVIAQLAVAFVLSRVLDTTNITTIANEATIAPWLIPAVLSALAAIVAVRRKATGAWWKWLILTMVIPTVGGALVVAMVRDHNIDASSVAVAVVTHVAVAGVLGISIGTVLNAARRTAKRFSK